MRKTLVILGLGLLAIGERLIFDLGPNIELITVVTIIIGIYMRMRLAVLAALFIAVISDLIMGNSSILLFTWSGFLFPVLLIKVFNLVDESDSKKRILKGGGVGVVSNFLFYFWTNFGVWALDSFNMYPNTAHGLYMSYVNGLPFLKMQIVSNAFIVPGMLIVIEGIRLIVNQLRVIINKEKSSYIKIV